MSTPKAVVMSVLLAFAEARFGQEQIPVDAVSQLGNAGFGDPGVAATLAGSIPGSLLAAANPCDKLTIADSIITKLGTDQQVIDAAAGLVAAETNFNPFVVNKPFVCADATLPASKQLRGIIPLVDPAVTGSDAENANSKTSVATPFDATGLSQGEVMIAQGFSNFTAVAADGTDTVLTGQDGAAAGNTTAGADASSNGTASSGGGAATAGAVPCGGKAGNGNASASSTTSAGAPAATDTTTGSSGGNITGSADAGSLDFGLCQPTMAFVGGLDGRPATEFTFIPQDPLVAKGQQEALNPSIITNRICDQLTNVCESSDDAKAACLDAKAQIAALGTRDKSTADMWNSILGFADADSTVATL